MSRLVPVMMLIKPTIEERQVLRAFDAAKGQRLECGVVMGDGGVAFLDSERDLLIGGLCLMVPLGHDPDVVRGLLNRINDAVTADPEARAAQEEG